MAWIDRCRRCGEGVEAGGSGWCACDRGPREVSLGSPHRPEIDARCYYRTAPLDVVRRVFAQTQDAMVREVLRDELVRRGVALDEVA